LDVQIGVVKSSSIYAVSIKIALFQDVLIVRDSKTRVIASTWDKSSVKIVGANNVATGVRDSVKDHVDEFINDYLSVNPK
jgi:hypothetical protein